MFTANNVWMMLCAGLVFIMHLGFATLESGLTRSKNTTNILFKNTFIVSVGILTYALIGFSLMYPGDFNGVLGWAGLGIRTDEAGLTIAYASGGYTYWTDFLFQAMFAATAATIVSGAVAERIKLPSFMVFATLFVAIVYPIAGSWKWGGGWLDAAGFYDFAGSTLVHSVGGWRSGRCLDARPPARQVQRQAHEPDPGQQHAAGRHGCLPALARLVRVQRRFGALGGPGPHLVHAGDDLSRGRRRRHRRHDDLLDDRQQARPLDEPERRPRRPGRHHCRRGYRRNPGLVLIGAIAGVIVVGSVMLFDRLRIDDPVGAISVHLVCGIWGTLAVGLFSTNPKHTLGAQALGVVAYGVFTVASAFLLFGGVGLAMGLRVGETEELEGLDLADHGAHAYDFGGTKTGVADDAVAGAVSVRPAAATLATES